MSNVKNKSQASQTVQYTVITKTSSDFKKGTTDAAVYIQMIGTSKPATTPWVLLDNLFRDDFELGRTDKFSIKTVDVGLPDVIRLKINKEKDKDGWLCETVTIITPSSEKVVFTIQDLVYDEVSIRSGTATLPQFESNPLYRDIRRIEVENNKRTYQWHLLPTQDQMGWSLPRYGTAETYLDLPLLFQINDEQINNFRGQREIALMNTLFEFGKGLFRDTKITCTNDFQKLFHHPSLPKEMPRFHECWSTDEEFGRQLLNGVNPISISLCKEILPQFAQVEKEIFQNGTSFKSEIEAKRLYCINYRGLFDDVKRNCNKAGNQLHCCDPICMLHVGSDKLLRPIAIQLEEGGEVFTPKDSEHDWLLAKMYFRNADLNIHEWQFHFLRTHAIMEPVAIGMFRSLSKLHPLYKLLRPHLNTVPAINTLARINLIGPDAKTSLSLSLDGASMARQAFKNFNFEDLIIPDLLEKQGINDREALPFYHYREDCLLLWDVINNYISNMVQIFYKSDEDVAGDFELREFIRTVAFDGIAWAGFGTKGFPTELHTVSELTRYLTTIIFTCSVQHAATNFGQFEIYKFIPNAPGGLRKPPHKKSEGTLQRILSSLPDQLMGCLQVGTSFLLSTFAPNEIYLGNYPKKLFQHSEALKNQEDFRINLRKASSKIKERNKSLKFPYNYLLPESIPNSIAV